MQIDEENIPTLKDSRCVVLPDNKFKRRWDLLITLLLLVTVVFVPFRVAFYDEADPGMIAVETTVDVCFIIDIILTFFTAYEKNGKMEVRHKQLALAYFRRWFWIDVVSSIPFQLFEQIYEPTTNNQFVEFTRYTRIIRILRLIKILRFAKKNKGLKIFKEWLNLSSSSFKLLMMCALVLFLTHLIACLFFLQAKW